MEAKLNAETIHYLKKILDTSFTHEETAESIVPDALPDIDTIVDATGTVTLKAKDADTGRISLSGTIVAAVVYRSADSSSLKRLELNIPFSGVHDAAGVTDESKLSLMVRIGGIDARIINSRKVLVRADLLIEAIVYEPDTVTYYDDIGEQEETGIQLLQDSVAVTLVTEVREKIFVLSDEFPLPAGKPDIKEILRSDIRLHTDDVKSVGNKLIFKGTAVICILYAEEMESEPVSLEFTAPFSQIMEMDEEAEGGEQEVRLALTNLYVEHGGISSAEETVIAVEMHIAAQAIARKKCENQYISDIYSTTYDLSERREKIPTGSNESSVSATVEHKETIALPTAGRVERVFDVSWTVGKAYFSEADDAFKTNVTLSILYSGEEGEISGFSKKVEVSSSAEYSADTISGVSAYVSGSVQATPAGGEVNVSIPVTFEIRPVVPCEISAVTEVTWDEENPRDLSKLPSVIIHRAGKGEDLWHMAKRFASTEELILAANDLEDGSELSHEQLLIIPRRRQ